MRIVDFLKNNSSIQNMAQNRLQSADSTLTRNPLGSMFSSTQMPDSSTFGEVSSTLGDIWDTILHGNATKYNKEIAEQNLDFQRENLEYQKLLQQELFNREDNSYERMVSSARSAGLSPLGLQALPQAGQVATQPLNNQMNYESTSALTAISSLFQTFMGFKTGLAELANLNAQTNKTNAEAQQIANSNSLFNYDLESEAYNYRLFKDKVDYLIRDSEWTDVLDNKEFLRRMGWTQNMPDWLKILGVLTNNKMYLNNEYITDSNKAIPFQNDIWSDDYYKIFNFDSLTDDLESSISSLGESLFKHIPGMFGDLVKNFFKGIFGSTSDSAIPDLLGYNKKYGSKIDYATKYLALVNHFSRRS